MYKKVAFFDYTNGQHTYHELDDNITSVLAKRIIETHLKYTNNQGWCIVEFNEDGSQVWKDALDQRIRSPQEIEEEVRRQIDAMLNK